jgi:superfamily II DNA/RNA helicase
MYFFPYGLHFVSLGTNYNFQVTGTDVFLVYRTCVRAVVIYGGTQLGHSIRQIVQGCNVLCATPGRLMDIIGKEKVGLRITEF